MDYAELKICRIWKKKNNQPKISLDFNIFLYLYVYYLYCLDPAVLYEEVKVILHDNILLCINIIIITIIIHASTCVDYLQGFTITKREFYFSMYLPYRWEFS